MALLHKDRTTFDTMLGVAVKQKKPKQPQTSKQTKTTEGQRNKRWSATYRTLLQRRNSEFSQWTLPLKRPLLQVESLLKTCIIHVVVFYAEFLVPPPVLDYSSAEFPGRCYLPKLH